jgi:hypothetical protein
VEETSSTIKYVENIKSYIKKYESWLFIVNKW